MTDLIARLRDADTTRRIGESYADTHERRQRDRDEAAAEIERLRAAMQWRPIEEAPKDGSYFVGLMQDRRIRKAQVDIVHWIDDPVWPIEGYGTGYEIGAFTHWMPLPPPPAGEPSDE